MGKIKKVLLPQQQLLAGDVFDRAFWDEFAKLEERTSNELWQAKEALPNGRLVSITIRDEESGEEWVIERVWLTRDQMKNRVAS